MAQSNAEVTAKQSALIAALLTHDGISDAAKAAGVAQRTAFRWLQDETFQREYRAVRRQVVQQAYSSIQRATSDAVATLRRNLKAKNAAVQVSAARAILEYAVRSVEIEELEQQLAEVRAIVEGLSAPEQQKPRLLLPSY